MTGVALFSIVSIGLSKLRENPCTRRDALRHNLREIQAELGADRHIDPARSGLNVVMYGADTTAAIEAEALLSLAGAGGVPPRKDHCQAVELLFSLKAGTTIDTNAYFRVCLEWAVQAVPLPVLSAVIHYDEECPHAHVVMLPIQNGRHVGSALIAKPKLKQLRESFFKAVASRYGLKRGEAKLCGTVKKWGIAAVLRECEQLGHPETLGALWPVVASAIERNPLPAMDALGIDIESIRPRDKGDVQNLVGIASPMSNPIGIEQTPIGIGNAVETKQSLSCVGIATPTPSPSLPVSPADNGTSATITPATTAPPKKLELARAALDEATRPRPKSAPIHDTRGQDYSVDRSDCAPPDWDASPQNWQEGGFDDPHGGELWH